MGETRMTFEDTCPSIPFGIDGTDKQKGKQLKESAMLIWHKIADDAATRDIHTGAHAEAFLDELFAGMPRRGGRWVWGRLILRHRLVSGNGGERTLGLI